MLANRDWSGGSQEEYHSCEYDEAKVDEADMGGVGRTIEADVCSSGTVEGAA